MWPGLDTDDVATDEISSSEIFDRSRLKIRIGCDLIVAADEIDRKFRCLLI